MAEIVLYQFAGGDGQDSWSSFCTKVHRILTFKGLDYRPKVVSSPVAIKRINPGARKVPVLSYDGTLVPDSSRIARFLDERHPEPSLWPSDARERALAHAFEDWADESLYWYVVYHRWQVDEYFEPFAKTAFAAVPAPLRPIVKRAARGTSLKQLHGQGLGRLDRDTVRGELERHLDALNQLLQDREWIAADAPSIADIALFAVIQGVHSPAFPDLRALVEARPALVAWARRVDDRTTGQHTTPWQ